MCFRWVAGVALPAVVRMGQCQFAHYFVAVSFCKDRSGCNILVGSVSFDLAVVRDVLIRMKSVPIDGDKVGLGVQLCNAPMHRFNTCVQDIHRIYLLRTNVGNCPGNCFLFYNGSKQVALFFGQLFGVVEQVVFKVGRQYYSSSRYWPSKTATTRFIRTGFNDGFKLNADVSFVQCFDECSGTLFPIKKVTSLQRSLAPDRIFCSDLLQRGAPRLHIISRNEQSCSTHHFSQRTVF